MSQVAKYLKDYQAPTHLLPKIDLIFDIFDEYTLVYSTLYFSPNHHSGTENLVLQGSAELVSIALNGEMLPETAYILNQQQLSILNTPQQDFTLSITTKIYPQNNQSLNGLYASGGNLYTQCEPEGFRTITYHPDRPDMMSIFTTEIRANRTHFPVLLSNGNLIRSGMLPENRHFSVWHDPFAKPSYLFALVAGNLVCTKDTFVTQSHRSVEIAFYTRQEDADKVHFAIESLKHAMRWDEQRFNLEYDLDIYMVVAVGDFNMGAMENKGLNIFNTKYVLADPQTATDADFDGIESVIAHEYFHNWTGNRVTCRDWFQLSLKEGLTVFRDQEFSADRSSREVRRIENVALLRQHQFPEDAGPMAHPVRPASYVEMNNFYTMTVYEKGAEVVRMYHTLLGEEGFQRGMKLYFERHDGQAVTCDDFLSAMADANHKDLSQFALWYSQAGTPTLHIQGQLTATHLYTLKVKQILPDTPDMPAEQKQAMLIPLKIALFSPDGVQLSFKLPENPTISYQETVLSVNQFEQEFTFQLESSVEHIIPSLLRGFSAPVYLHYPYNKEELGLLAAHDTDTFAAWEAVQNLYRQAIAENEAAIHANQALPTHSVLKQALTHLFNSEIEPQLLATRLTIPSEAEIWAKHTNINPHTLHQARTALLNDIAQHYHQQFTDLEQRAKQEEDRLPANTRYHYTPQAAAWRSLRNTCRQFLLRSQPNLIEQYTPQSPEFNSNMTHEWGILTAINHNKNDRRNEILNHFAKKFADQALVMDKYFTLIASSHRTDTLKQVQSALQHPQFTLNNPNKVRALIGSFIRNIPHFHAIDGSGYRFVSEQIQKIDSFNPQSAAGLTRSAFSLCHRLEPKRKNLMLQELNLLAKLDSLSKDTREIVEKTLNQH